MLKFRMILTHSYPLNDFPYVLSKIFPVQALAIFQTMSNVSNVQTHIIQHNQIKHTRVN